MMNPLVTMRLFDYFNLTTITFKFMPMEVKANITGNVRNAPSKERTRYINNYPSFYILRFNPLNTQLLQPPLSLTTFLLRKPRTSKRTQ